MSIPKEKIIEAAEKAGFDTELKVAASLAKAGWQVQQNVYYIDKDENKGRELDIHAYKILSKTDVSPEVTAHVDLCIEVKKTKDPFIFFTNRRGKFERGSGYGLFHWSHRVDRHVLNFQDIESARPGSRPLRLARSYCSFKDSKEKTDTQHIRSGLLSAVKAAIHKKNECNEQYSDKSHDICFFLPIVIVDGPLYECFLHPDSDELTAEETNFIVYSQNYLSANYGTVSSQILVVNFEILEEHLERQTLWIKHIFETIQAKKAKYVGD